MRLLFNVAFRAIEPFLACFNKGIGQFVESIGRVEEGLTAWRADGYLGVEDVFAIDY